MSALVITVHGIRTFGDWQNRLRALLAEADADVESHEYSYGYFSVLAFLIPPLRWLVVRTFRRKLIALLRRHPGRRVSIVAHSFGTHVVAYALRSRAFDQYHIELVLLSGSVLPVSFDWEPIVTGGRVGRVVNDCGINDGILVLSQAFVVLTGMAGRVGFQGFQNRSVVNRFFMGGHSLYFLDKGLPSDAFMLAYWLPVILQGTVERIDQRHPPTVLEGLVQVCLPFADVLKTSIYLVMIGAVIFVWQNNVRRADQERLVTLQTSRALAVNQLQDPATRSLGIARFLQYATDAGEALSTPDRALVVQLRATLLPLSERWGLFTNGSLVRVRDRLFLKRADGWATLEGVSKEVESFRIGPDGAVALFEPWKRLFILQGGKEIRRIDFNVDVYADANTQPKSWPALDRLSVSAICSTWTRACKNNTLVGHDNIIRPFLYRYQEAVPLHFSESPQSQAMIYTAAHSSVGMNTTWIGIVDSAGRAMSIQIGSNTQLDGVDVSPDCRKLYLHEGVSVSVEKGQIEIRRMSKSELSSAVPLSSRTQCMFGSADSMKPLGIQNITSLDDLPIFSLDKPTSIAAIRDPKTKQRGYDIAGSGSRFAWFDEDELAKSGLSELGALIPSVSSFGSMFFERHYTDGFLYGWDSGAYFKPTLFVACWAASQQMSVGDPCFDKRGNGRLHFARAFPLAFRAFHDAEVFNLATGKNIALDSRQSGGIVSICDHADARAVVLLTATGELWTYRYINGQLFGTFLTTEFRERSETGGGPYACDASDEHFIVLEGTTLRAFDAKTGTELWRTELKGIEPSYSTGVRMLAGGLSAVFSSERRCLLQTLSGLLVDECRPMQPYRAVVDVLSKDARIYTVLEAADVLQSSEEPGRYVVLGRPIAPTDYANALAYVRANSDLTPYSLANGKLTRAPFTGPGGDHRQR